MNGRTAGLGGMRNDSPAQASPGVLLIGRLSDAFSSLRQFLESRNCSMTRCTSAANAGQQVNGLDPQLIVVSAPRLLRVAARSPG